MTATYSQSSISAQRSITAHVLRIESGTPPQPTDMVILGDKYWNIIYSRETMTANTYEVVAIPLDVWR